MRGLPPIVMSIAMTITWWLVGTFGFQFASVASVVLSLAWLFVSYSYFFNVLISVLGALAIYSVWPEQVEAFVRGLLQVLGIN